MCAPCVGCIYPPVLVVLIAVGTSMGRIYPKANWLQGPAVIDHHRRSVVQGSTPKNNTYFTGALAPTESAPWLCHLWKRLGEASTWSEVFQEVLWLWGFQAGANRGQLPPVSCPGPLGISYKVICWLLLPVMGLEVLRRGQGWLLLVLSVGSLGTRFAVHQGQLLLVWEILGISEAWTKIGNLYGKATGNGLGWACKLGGVWSQGITRSGWTLLARLIKIQI